MKSNHTVFPWVVITLFLFLIYIIFTEGTDTQKTVYKISNGRNIYIRRADGDTIKVTIGDYLYQEHNYDSATLKAINSEGKLIKRKVK